MKITLANLDYNIDRLISHERREARVVGNATFTPAFKPSGRYRRAQRSRHAQSTRSYTLMWVPTLGSRLIDQSQKMTVAASAIAEKKTVGHRS